MSLNPAEYHIPVGNYTIDVPQPAEVVRNEIETIYDNSKVADFGLRRERRLEPKISEHYEKLTSIRDDVLKLRQDHLDSNFFSVSQSGVIGALAKRLAKINTISLVRPLTEDDLIKRESREVGSKLFGETPPDKRIEFFIDRDGHIFFFDETKMSKGVIKSVTLHYEILPAGVLCISSESGIKGTFLDGDHLDNFLIATEAYRDLVKEKIYKHNHNSGKKVA